MNACLESQRTETPPALGAGAPCLGFWQAGFDGADHVNGSAIPLSGNTLTAHVRNAAEDYRRLSELGIRTVRESAGWRCIERSSGYDFSSVGARAKRASEAGMQVLWTCFHYGMPRGLDLFSPEFGERFARYCGALARYLRPYHRGDTAPVYTPIHEISTLCRTVCETRLLHPYRGDRGAEMSALRRQLVRAHIMACDAIFQADARARILVVDPLLHLTSSDPALAQDAQRANHEQFLAWDMLCGRSEPQLGGDRCYLDVVGISYYADHQRDLATGHALSWPDDPRRRPLSSMLAELHARYGRPISIGQTGHQGEQRAAWLAHVAQEVRHARNDGIPVNGLCLYPAIDRPDWEQPQRWHPSGLWHVDPTTFRRRLNRPYASA
ncbi:MAG TPA: beta-glucosidase [Pseudoxanthomonas sp.]|nr:beta-glucosidase [Pseudoxanthomonas sp.]